MRRLFILGLLFLLMYALQFLQVAGEAPFDPLSLATFGFILLAAYTLGEIASKLSLPKITGYIFTGLLFGPYVINLFSVGVVSDLRVINELAIGMIALSAGGEMKMDSLRQISRSLTLIVLIKCGLTLAVVTGTVYFIAPMLPFMADMSTPLILAIGSIFGVLAMGTSPAATIAVINETGSKGRLADTTLGVAVFKDVVMVVLLAIAIAMTKVFSTPDGAFDPHVLLLVGEELGLSILVGAALGGIIIAYMRWIHAEMWLFIIAVIFAMTEVAHVFHLEALLMFIAAGFVVQNFSKHGDHLVHLVEAVALPVYVVFFSVAGAGLDLAALASVGVVALIIVAVRLGAIYAGTGLATRLAGEPEPIRKNAWLSFVSQAGVVIGLTIIIERNLPELGPDIRTVVLGIVAINLIVGPILFKMALSNVGETAAKREGTPALADASEDGAEPETIAAPKLPAEVRYPTPAFASTRLNNAANKLLEPLVPLGKDFGSTFLTSQTVDLVAFLEQMRVKTRDALRKLERELQRAPEGGAINLLRNHRTALAEWLQEAAASFAEEPHRAVRGAGAFEDLFKALHRLSIQVDDKATVMQEVERYQPLPDDSLYVRFRKSIRRVWAGFSRVLGSGVPDNRKVPIRRIARYQLDGLLPQRLLKVASMTAAQPYFVVEKSRVLFHELDGQFKQVLAALQEAEDAPVPAEAARQMGEAMEIEFGQAIEDVHRYQREVEQRMAYEMAQAFGAVLDDFARAGTFELPARKRRFSQVNEDSHAARTEAKAAFETWQQATHGVTGNLVKYLEIVTVRDQAQRVVDETVVDVSDRIEDRVCALVKAALAACEEHRDALQAAFAETPTAEAAQAALHNAQETLSDTLQKQVITPLQQIRRNRGLNALLDRMLQQFSAIAAQVPESVEVIEPQTLPAPGDGIVPDDVRMRIAPLRDVARTYLETKVARNIATANQTLLREVDAAITALSDVRQLIRFNLEAALEELDDDAPNGSDDATPVQRAKTLALEGMERARERLKQAETQVDAFVGTVHKQILESTAGLLDTVGDEVTGHSEVSMKLQQQQQRALATGTTALSRLRTDTRDWFRATQVGLQRRFRPLAQEVMRDLRAGRGLNELSPAEVLNRYDQAVLDPAFIEQLPFIYQKLFALTPLEADEFMKGREAELDTLTLALKRWEGGTPCAVAVMAEPGMGRTSFHGVASRSVLAAHLFHTICLTRKNATEEFLLGKLADALETTPATRLEDMHLVLQDRVAADAPPRPVILLEDLHHLFERRPGGFDLLRRLLVVIASTGDDVFWIASMPGPAWRYLDAALGIADAFAFTITLTPLTRDELEEAILTRHRVSGLDLAFLPTTLTAQRGKYRRAEEAEQQQITQKDYFDNLARLSNGHPLTALFYWLKSIEKVEGDRIVMRPIERLKLGYARKLDLEEHLTLRVVREQGALSPDELAYLLATTTATAQQALLRLASLHLLVPAGDAAPQAYRLNPILAQTLAEEMQGLNM